jgi:hypothetical protein
MLYYIISLSTIVHSQVILNSTKIQYRPIAQPSPFGFNTISYIVISVLVPLASGPRAPFLFALIPYVYARSSCVFCDRNYNFLEHASLLRCDAVSLVEHFPTFGRTVVLLSTESTSTRRIPDHDDDGTVVLPNIHKYPRNYTESYSRRLESSATPL